MEKVIGIYLGNGMIELNRYGCEKLIGENIKRGEIITEEELIKRQNKKLKKDGEND